MTPSGAKERGRRWIAWTAAALVCVALVAVAAGLLLWSRAKTTTVGEIGFNQKLQIPPLLEPTVDDDGRRVFELRAQQGTSRLIPGKSTRTWGFNGSYLGPTLRASRGEDVRMRVTNGLGEATTVHWHGMHLPAAADGGPHQPIEPGETWTPGWRIDQPAATLWYHPHRHATTEEHVYRGLAGMFILDDRESAVLDLPRRYGIDDVPVIVQDKRFTSDGELSFAEGLLSPIGQLGREILVNGTHGPYIEAQTTLVRLRLLNASTARSYNLGFSDDREFALIATDAGLLGAPASGNRIQLSPGERAEIVVGVAAGDTVVLRSFEPDLGETDFLNARFSGADDSFDILQIRTAKELAQSPPLPATLAQRAEVDPAVARRVRRFELGSRDINDREMDLRRIDQVVTSGTSEIWEVENRSGIPHNFHPHGVSFTVLEQDGRTPPAMLRGAKDTVSVNPGVTIRLLTTLGEYRDPAVPYMFHCHLLQHEDRGMMGQYVVVGPGQQPESPPVHGTEPTRGRP